MSKYLSNRQKNLKVGIESYTENLTSLSVVGKVGIGTTNASTDLDVVGGVRIRGGILDLSNSSGTNSYVVTANGSGGWSWQPVSAGVATYVENAGYASTAGIATNLKGGAGGQIVYQSAVNTTAFLTNGSSGYLLQANGGTNAPSWVAAAPADAITGLTIRDEGNIVGSANSVSQLNFVGVIVSVASTAGIATITFLDYVSNAGIATFATTAGIATNLKGGLVGNVPYQSATNTTAFLINGSSGTILQSNGVGNAPSWVSAAPAAAITGLTIRDEGNIVGSANSVSQLNFVGNIISVASTSGIATITLLDYVSNAGIATSVIGGIASVSQLQVTGVSTLGTVRISSGIVTATSGIVTYYGDGQYLSGITAGGGYEQFNTGITSSLQLKPLSYETTVFTFPSTAGKQYVIESINAANVDTSVGVGTTVNIIASIQDTSGEQTYIAYNVPVVNGGLIELLKNAMVAGPSDVIKMWVTNGNYVGVNTAVEVYINYTEFTSTEYIREYASTVSIATTNITGIFTSTTYPSVIESIHLANRTDIGDYPVSVTITNGVTTTFLAKDLLIPRYSTVDILDRPKRIELNGTLGIKVGQTSTIDVIIAGKQIT